MNLTTCMSSSISAAMRIETGATHGWALRLGLRGGYIGCLNVAVVDREGLEKKTTQNKYSVQYQNKILKCKHAYV